MYITKEIIISRRQSHQYVPFEFHRRGKWRTAIFQAESKYIIYCDPLKELGQSEETNYKKSDVGDVAMAVGDVAMAVDWQYLDDANTLFAEIGTIIHPLLWNWKALLGHNFVSLKELLTGFSRAGFDYAVKGILSSMIEKCPASELKELPIRLDPILSIYLPDDTMFYNSYNPENINSTEFQLFIKNVLNQDYPFSDKVKEFAYYRLIESGASPSDFEKHFTGLVGKKMGIVNRIIKNLREVNYQIRRSIMLLPGDIRSIIYSYIAWWKNANISEHLESSLLWEERYVNYKVHTDNKILLLTTQLEEANRKLKLAMH